MSALGTIGAALAELPARCRYHGENVEDTHHLRSGPPPHACCETGRPALLRRLAEDALRGLAGPEEHGYCDGNGCLCEEDEDE